MLGSDCCPADLVKPGCSRGIDAEDGNGSEGSGAVYGSVSKRGVVTVVETRPAEPRRNPAMVDISEGAARE